MMPNSTATDTIGSRSEMGPDEALTDAAHAERFARDYGLKLRFNHRRGVWYYYDPPIWRPDTNGAVYRFALEFVRSCQQDALNIRERRVKEKVLRFALNAESKAGLDRLVALAKVVKPLADDGEGWDADLWLLGTPNAVIDLRTGKSRPGDPLDRITMRVAYPFDPNALAPRFERFLEEVFGGDTELIEFVHRFVGYCLTGITTEQVLAVFYGRGANGKSTLINTLAHVLGQYAHNLPFSTVELRQRSSIPNDLAALDGKRFVTASETNDGARLNEARIKALTGGDAISARFLHNEWFTFQPVAKFVLAVNHRPTVHDDSLGFWRRIRLVPFQQSFERPRRNDGLERELRMEGPGILRWAVEGCVAWRRQGLGQAEAIRIATGEYQKDSDPLADFLDECCEIVSDGTLTMASVLQQTYEEWADRLHLGKTDRLNGRDFSQRLRERFPRRHTKKGWFYEGIRVVGRLSGDDR